MYAVAIALGLVFGGVATMGTRLTRDDDGVGRTVTGPLFVGVWALAVVLRLAFVWSVRDWGWAQVHFGEFVLGQHVSLEAIAPFFVIWALTMVLARMVALKVRALTLAERPARVAAAA